MVRVCCIYLPNGNPVDTDKFPYKLSWMDRLQRALSKSRLKLEEPFILLGDFNIIPAAIDAKTPEKWVGDALFRPESAARWRTLLNLGHDRCAARRHRRAVLHVLGLPGRSPGDRDDGIRIDHLLLSPQAADRLIDVIVHKDVRGWDKPSDHVPVEGEFAF